MDLLDKRGANNEELLQQRFIQRILMEEAAHIDEAQIKLMTSRGFNSPEFFSGRSFNAKDTVLRYEHLAKHRFVDMASRQTKTGRKKKVAHKQHNRILYGHANNIVFRLSVEYTQRMKAMLLNEYNLESRPDN